MRWTTLLNKSINAMARAAREDEKRKTEEIIREIAEELSRNKKFLKCKNNAERAIIIEQLYPEIAQTKTNVNKIIRRSKALATLRKKRLI